MDSRRFDALVRSLGTGASRRSVLRGLLGLGGAAILADRTDARTIGTRPTLPPPPPPPPPTTTTPKPTTTTPDPCPSPNVRCGLECCSDDLHCCDRECCAPDAVCLTKAFYGEVPPVEEEFCCLLDQTCDGQCCSGNCFWPATGETNGATVLESFDRECCPAEVGFTFCEGEGAFSAFGLCCSGETATCCHNSLGAPVCITDDQCCTTDECVEAGFDRDCITCNIDTNTCEPSPYREHCNGSECGICEAGHCLPYGVLCETCEICTAQLTCGPLCNETQTCCSDHCFHGVDRTCCQDASDCPNACFECQKPEEPGPGICESGCAFECCPVGQSEEYYCINDADTCCAACENVEKCCYGHCIHNRAPCCFSDEDCADRDDQGACGVSVCTFHICLVEPLPDNSPCQEEEGICCGGNCVETGSTCCHTHEECFGIGLEVPSRCIDAICDLENNICVARNFCSNAEGSRRCCQAQDGDYYCDDECPRFCEAETVDCCTSHEVCASLDVPSKCIEGLCNLDNNICVARNFCSSAEGSRRCCQAQDGDYYCDVECPPVCGLNGVVCCSSDTECAHLGTACTPDGFSYWECRSGICVNPVVSCNDQDVCTLDTCDPDNGCSHVKSDPLCCTIDGECGTNQICNTEINQCVLRD